MTAPRSGSSEPLPSLTLEQIKQMLIQLNADQIEDLVAWVEDTL